MPLHNVRAISHFAGAIPNEKVCRSHPIAGFEFLQVLPQCLEMHLQLRLLIGQELFQAALEYLIGIAGLAEFFEGA